MKLLVTGGSGFIGSHFIRHMLKKDIEIVNYDKLTYAGNIRNNEDIKDNPRYHFTRGDICDAELLVQIIDQYEIDHIVNFAAESHVDRAIEGQAYEFINTNASGVLTLLNIVRANPNIKKFIHISTDEVYGSLELQDEDIFKENSPLRPNQPYGASKAAGDLLCQAYYKTHNVPVIITRCSNNYGTHQNQEKLIPTTISRILENKKAIVHGDGYHVRDWIHVLDNCTAIELLLEKGKPGQIYNIGASNERCNLDVVGLLLKIIGKPKNMINFMDTRKMNDRRYAVDATKLRLLGWSPMYSKQMFEIGLREVVDWYFSHQEWLK